jgi:hypothetical protein
MIAAAELTAQDFVENLVVKIVAIGPSLVTMIDGVEVPYLDLKTLIESKRTERDQDKVDIQRLRDLAKEN